MAESTRVAAATNDKAGTSTTVGLIGQRNSGMTGLVRSLVVEASAPGASLFADRWRFAPVNSPSLQPGTSGDPSELQRSNLLAYLAPPDDPADDGLAKPRSAPNDLGINHFAIAPVSGWWRRKPRDAQSARVRAVQILDTSAAHRNDPRGRPGWVTHAYHTAPHVVLCHPILPQVQQQESYKRIFDELRLRFAESARGSTSPLRTLVVAFTHYEKMFVARSRDAVRRALDPDIARRQLQRSLQLCSELADELANLSAAADLQIVGIPVSTYGFVRGDGRSNFDLWLWDDEPVSGERAPARMLTRPDIYCRLLEAAHRDAGRVLGPPEATTINWLLRHWQPFLTADPFIACICDDKHDLVFPLSSLLEGARNRAAA